MSTTNGGGPAFPTSKRTETRVRQADNVHYEVGVAATDGMTLRDYFAAKIAAGDAAVGDGWGMPAEVNIEARAKLYYRIADAMLKARSE
jgi:hypothetical protein